ncbi:hypothetical protein [Actinomadura gamaensis]|uniref:Aminoacyl-transfer RNA synthetases class-II family profile domain-containing protein n=1 Tax=Actinomadura gamaensis TaxID=1763541 RepID=A0ABV9TY85_9ACTN
MDSGTITRRVDLDPPVPEEYADELSARVFFVSPAIVGFSLVRSGSAIHAVDLRLSEDGANDADGKDSANGKDGADGLERKLRFVVANDVLAQRRPEPKVIWRGRDVPAPRPGVYDVLLERGVAVETGEGQVALAEPVLTLMDRLDARVRDLVVREFGAREYRYPTLLPTAVLGRCGYYRSFPQLMMFVSRLHEDVDDYRAFLDDLSDGRKLTEALRGHSGDPDLSLPPTMCLYTYHQFADGPLDASAPVVTSRGKSFRFESRYRRSLERLWDFTIRETVFLGPRDVVLERRRRLMERAFALMDELDLGGRCEVANDPFFVDAATAQRAWSQQMLELKYELRLPVADGRDVSVASFNFHDTFFAGSFGIAPAGPDDGAVHTACAGFGLERLAYAFVCRHGPDPAAWPGGLGEGLTP